MASIIKNEEQIKALRDIEENLEAIKQLNQVILSGGEGAFVGIAQEKGKPIKVDVDEKERKVFTTLCTKMRERVVRDTQAKAEKYHIHLDDADRKVLAVPGEK